MVVLLNWFDLEVGGDEGKNEGFQVLHQVVEDFQALRVLALLHVNQRPNL